MVREMITLPLRLGVSATHLGLRVAARAADAAVRITRLTIGGSGPTEAHAADDAPDPSSAFVVDVVIAPSPVSPEASPAAAPAPVELAPEGLPTPPSPPEVAPAAELRAVAEMPPAHVSEGVQFVEAFAEAGAEQGAGAAVHVREPWRGYAQMTANEVIVHLASASPEELAAVALFEGAHRRRKTVLAAARRQLRSATAGGPAAQARRA